jgi:hypothetical protein
LDWFEGQFAGSFHIFNVKTIVSGWDLPLNQPFDSTPAASIAGQLNWPRGRIHLQLFHLRRVGLAVYGYNLTAAFSLWEWGILKTIPRTIVYNCRIVVGIPGKILLRLWWDPCPVEAHGVGYAPSDGMLFWRLFWPRMVDCRDSFSLGLLGLPHNLPLHPRRKNVTKVGGHPLPRSVVAMPGGHARK